jgi:glycosyltransferase involved in cell wall biosynthesis
MRVIVVSHACTVDANRDVYRVLAAEHGHDVHLVVPASWPAAFVGSQTAEPPDDGLTVHHLPVRLAGQVQRHFYRWTNVNDCLRRTGPDVVLVEEESLSLAGTQWAAAARRQRLPYALQNAENIAGRVPAWWRPVVRRNLGGAGLVLARSHSAVDVARAWGAAGRVDFLPHALPRSLVRQAELSRNEHETATTGVERAPFVIGFAGRLVPEKGFGFLIDVLQELRTAAPVRLLVAGRGPEDVEMGRLASTAIDVEKVTLSHDRMGEFYRRLDVLAVPSRTTPTWAEQFGRVITEAACFGVPVLGSDSGEIPWVIEDLAAGRVIAEDAVGDWRDALSIMVSRPDTQDAGALRARALERYSAESVAERLDSVLTSWLGAA